MKSYIFGLVILIGSIWLVLSFTSSAPGASFVGRGAPSTSDEDEAADRIAGVCEGLAVDIGPRGASTGGSQADVDQFVLRELRRLHLDPVELPLDCAGAPGKAFEVMLPGRALGRETILLTAHFDSAPGSPGADDDASGVAMLLEVLRTLTSTGIDRTLRAAIWSGGAAPTGGTEKSAAAAYAKRLHARHENVAAILCFESVGIYSDTPGSQHLPFPLDYCFPETGDFVAFVGDWGSRGIMDHTLEQFRLSCKFPSQAFNLPSMMDFTSLSDDGVLRDAGYPALRVTDTGAWRNPAVGGAGDVVGNLDYRRMARVARGVADTVIALGKRTTTLL